MKFFIDLALDSVISAIFVFVSTRLISGIRLSFKDSLWVSFISIVTASLFSLLIGFVLASYPRAMIVSAFAFCWFIQVVVLQVMARTTAYKQVLPARKAGIISLIAVIAQYFVASPLAAWLNAKIL